MDDPVKRKAAKFIEKLGLPAWGPRHVRFTDWTGLPVDVDPPGSRRDPSPMAGALRALADKLGVQPADDGSPDAGEAIRAAWRQVAGGIADRFVPEKFVGGILYVVGGSSTEIFEIRRTRLRAIEAAARRLAAFKGLRQIRLRAGTAAAAGL